MDPEADEVDEQTDTGAHDDLFCSLENGKDIQRVATFQSFLLFRIFVQSRIPFMSPTQTDFVVSSRLLDDRWINIWTGCLAMVGCASVSVCGGLVDYALGFPRAER